MTVFIHLLCLLASVKEVKLAYYEHILRKKDDCLEKEIIQGTITGSRTRGRPKMTWTDNKSWTGLSLTELVRNVEDRHKWRKNVHGAASPRSKDSERQAGSLCSLLIVHFCSGRVWWW